MKEYLDYPKIKKIISTDSRYVYYIDTNNKIKKFDTDRIKRKQCRERIKKNISKAKVIAGNLVWDFADDDAFFGIDTISDYSLELKFDEILQLMNILNKKRKLTKQKLLQFLSSIL